ncbi:hypothetical protein [Robertmurraya sp.]|uniref:hypothetical protein n=1 Tax=Robertmurraya sp. TaxID=2837525 RepID=UPI0037046CBD
MGRFLYSWGSCLAISFLIVYVITRNINPWIPLGLVLANVFLNYLAFLIMFGLFGFLLYKITKNGLIALITLHIFYPVFFYFYNIMDLTSIFNYAP